jgi:hypothetical protein
VRLAETEAPQRRDLALAPLVVDLRRGQDHRPVRAAQGARDGLVDRRRPDLPVDHQQDHVRGGHRRLGLGRDRGLHALGVGLPAAGVEQREPPPVPQRVVGDPVARHARDVLDHGLTPAQDAVDQRRLADVGAPDHGEHRLDRCCLVVGQVARAFAEQRSGQVLRHVILL